MRRSEREKGVNDGIQTETETMPWLHDRVRAALRDGDVVAVDPPSAEASRVPAGWSPSAWARLLRQRADACQAVAPTIAARHREEARRIEGPPAEAPE